MTDIGEKISSLRKSMSLSRKAFSEKVGIAETKLYNIETGHQRADHKFIEILLNTLNVDANWLLNSALGIDDNATNSSEFIPIKRYDIEVSAGDGSLADDAQAMGFYGFNRYWLKRKSLDPNNLSIVIVTGNSMIPYLNDNDLVLVDHKQNQIIDGRTFVLRYNDSLYVKNLQMAPNNILHIVSANVEYPPIPIDLKTNSDDIIIIGRVVASMRDWI